MFLRCRKCVNSVHTNTLHKMRLQIYLYYFYFCYHRISKLRNFVFEFPESVLFYTHQCLKKGKNFRKDALNHTHHSLHLHHKNRCRLQTEVLLLISLMIGIDLSLLHDLLIYIHQKKWSGFDTFQH